MIADDPNPWSPNMVLTPEHFTAAEEPWFLPVQPLPASPWESLSARLIVGFCVLIFAYFAWQFSRGAI